MRAARLMAVDGFAPSPGLLTVPETAVPPPGGPLEEAVEILALTLWSEAAAQPVRALEAVASVIMNRVQRARVRGGYWWGDSVVAVCQAPGQFACWTPGTPEWTARLAVAPVDPVLATCRRIARRALAGVLPDATEGATHFHDSSHTPSWTRGRVPSAEFGSFLFYNTVE